MRVIWLLLAVCMCILPVPEALAQPSPVPGSKATLEVVESVPLEAQLGAPESRPTATAWVEMIEAARQSVDLEAFYIRHQEGQALGPVLAALERAAARGVRVRIIADRGFQKTYPEALDRLSQVRGIEVRTLPMAELAGGVQHSKYFVVDGHQLFLGSQNVDWTSLSHIHEVGVLVDNVELATCAERIFEVDWQLAANPSVSATPVPVCRPQTLQFAGQPVEAFLGFSPPSLTPQGLRSERDELVSLLGRARHHIRIQVMNYSPVDREGSYWPVLDNALRAAAVRQVQVQLLVADWGTRQPALDHLKSLNLIPGIEVRVITIPKHSSGEIPFARVDHSKYAVIDDDWGWVGTSNWERGYFESCRDLSLFVHGSAFAGRLHQIFDTSWNSAYTGPLGLDREPYAPPQAWL